MKINPYFPSNPYKSRSAQPAGGAASAPPQAEQAHKTDTVSIGQGGRQSAFGGLVRKIAGEVVSSCDSAARVSELREAVAAGSYYVPTDDLAGAILSHVTAQ